ncbi:SidA/IucD/PvdA family monooxygenase [Vibrio sp.]|nr:SidA/IucD/PvdA family monooxygenase [Vibrio sp.]
MNSNINNNGVYDFIGVGAGPFNLSIAALLDTQREVKSLFLEGRESFAWHPGLLLDNTNMQTMFLKDLVSGVCPESPYSFLSYLVKNKKFYRFLSTELNCISRHEFSDYLSWVSRALSNIQFSTRVEKVEYVGELFQVTTNQGVYLTKHLCLGVGKVPFMPECTAPYRSKRVFHASEIGLEERDFSGKKVAIIGGGQSGADIFLNVMRGRWGQPASLDWVSRRANFQPLDEAAFTNEYFTPEYVDTFYLLNPEVKASEVAAQKMTSDGITQACLLDIYRELYHRFDVLKEDKWIRLMPNRCLYSMAPSRNESEYTMNVCNALSQSQEQLDADIVILATGFQSMTPQCLQPIKEHIHFTPQGDFTLSPNFEVQWSHSASNKLFSLNTGMHSHGIAEPQLSLMAWRSAKVINQFMQKPLYDLSAGSGMLDWVSGAETKKERVHQPSWLCEVV